MPGRRKYFKRETPAATRFPRYFEENTRGDGRYRKISFFYFSIARRQSSDFYCGRARNRNFHRRLYQATLAEIRRNSLKFVEITIETKAKREPGKDTGNVGTRDEGCRGIWRYRNFRCFSITITSGRCEYARRVPLRPQLFKYVTTTNGIPLARVSTIVAAITEKKKKRRTRFYRRSDERRRETRSHGEIRSRVTLRDGDIETRRGRKGRRTGSRVSGRNGTGKQSDIVY